MNERIQQLADEARLVTVNGQTRYALAEEFEQRFAELIVRECSKVIVNGGYRNPALGEKHPLTPPEIATMIREHFGVEE
jgi:hypothetical protein